MTVLIAEDLALMRQLLKNFLAPIATIFIETETMEATEAMITANPAIDFVALDLRFPDSSYLGTIEKIKQFREINPEAIIVVITGNSDPTLEEKAIAAGAHGFMFKPAVSKPETFMDRLRAVILSLIRQPSKYTRNLDLAERILEKILPRLQSESMESAGDITPAT